MATNKVILIEVLPRVQKGWTARLTLESGATIEKTVWSQTDVEKLASENGVNSSVVTYVDGSYAEIRASDLGEFRHTTTCPACASGTVSFDPDNVRRSDDNLEWFTFETFGHRPDCSAMEWAWNRDKNVVRVARERGRAE